MNRSVEIHLGAKQPAAMTLGAVDKALVILTTLSASAEPLPLAELSRRTGLPKTTVHRLLAVLCAHDMASRTGDRYFRIRLDAAGTRRPRPDTGPMLSMLRGESTPFLVELHNATGATASVSILVDENVHVVNQVYGHRGLRVTASRPAFAMPTAATSAAEMILRAYSAEPDPGDTAGRLADVRRAGIAHSSDPDSGVASFAVPVCDNGAAFRPPVALSISGRAGHYDHMRAARLLRHSSFAFARTLRRLFVGSVVGP